MKEPLQVNDVFITTFWGPEEVCKVVEVLDWCISFIRLESIRGRNTLKKDYCQATIHTDDFKYFPYRKLHVSKWYGPFD